MIYQNFDLEIITPREGQICARVLDSPQGDCPFVNVKWPFEVQEENELLSEIYGGLRQRRARSSRGGTIQDFGGKLFDAVFSGDIEHLFRSSLDTAARTGTGLRIRLRLPEESELHARPWEFLFDTESREFLAVREHTPLIRYLPVAQPIPPITVEGPLRILVALASPTDYPRLDIAREWEILCQALEPSITAGRLELRRVPGCCTFDNLRDSLRHFSTHIFHFVGHGLPGALVLEQESGKGLELEATRLRSAFPSGALPRLIVLNACSGAIAEDVPFSGLAQGFLKQGVSAVVAMQASITDNAALIFTRYFYRDLVETGAVDTSLTEARLRMQGNGHPIEWGTPVLYMRALSGQLFQPAPSPTERKRPRTARSKENPPSLETGQNLQHAVMPMAPSGKRTAPPPKVEPRLDEQDIAPSVQATQPLPVFKLAPESEPEPQSKPVPAPPMKYTPPGKGRTAYARWVLIYAAAGALLAAILFLATDIEKTSPAHKETPPPVILTPTSPASPTAASAASTDKPPTLQPSPAVPEVKATDSQVPDAQIGVPEASPKPPAHASRKTQPKTKPARPARADNCKNPDVSERDASCLFQ